MNPSILLTSRGTLQFNGFFPIILDQTSVSRARVDCPGQKEFAEPLGEIVEKHFCKARTLGCLNCSCVQVGGTLYNDSVKPIFNPPVAGKN